MQYAIVFSDIDGTLLTPEHLVSPFTKQTVLAVAKKHIPFVLVSARSPIGIGKITRSIGFRMPIICFNGALILDSEGMPLYQKGLSFAEVLPIKAFINANFPQIACNLYTKDALYVDDATNPYVREECSITNDIATLLDSVPLASDTCIYKIHCMGEAAMIDTLQQALKNNFPQYPTHKSKDTYLELQHSEVSKANALIALCGILGTPVNSAVAFGDHENDIAMLKAAGLGIAMGNALPTVKEAADFVAAPNWQDGLAHKIQDLFL